MHAADPEVKICMQVLHCGSLARPMLADAELINKALQGREDEINTCIACNQACLDHTFTGQEVSCLVNPRACHETLLKYEPTDTPRRIRRGLSLRRCAPVFPP